MPIPPILVKAFPSREYAEMFVAGIVRFSTLKFYREVEGDRRDVTEGAGAHKVIGEALQFNKATGALSNIASIEEHATIAIPEWHFICCFSDIPHGNFRELPRRFGEHYVIVSRPDQLIAQLQQAIARHPELSRDPPVLEYAHVRYDKGALLEKRLPIKERQLLGWQQKPEKFSDELEYRLHFPIQAKLPSGPTDHLSITVGEALCYCTVESVGP